MMMDMGLVVIIAIVALFIGLFAGFLISKAMGGSETAGNLKNQMESLEERFTNYQSEVANHFNTTTNIAQKLSQDYQDMQAHLQHSVEALVTDTELRTKLLAELKTNEQKALDYSVEGAEGNMEQTAPVEVASFNDIPRDYAPKAPGEPGTLTEEFAVKHK